MEIGIIVSKLIRIANAIMKNRRVEPFREVTVYEALWGNCYPGNIKVLTPGSFPAFKAHYTKVNALKGSTK